MQPEIIIQSDYWLGSMCLENGVPWQVPGSIYWEAANLRKDDVVLEVGTGGSTVFYARRTQLVVAIETNRTWADQVVARLKRENLKNVVFIHQATQRQIETQLLDLAIDPTVVSVDTVHGYNRSSLQFLALAGRNPRMLIVDNYASQELYPDHYWKNTLEDWRGCLSPGRWDMVTFDDPHWHGNGTKILFRED